MKLLYKGMKKVKFFLGSEKVPFGYEKKPVFENFPFHTLGYENFGCFFLMPLFGIFAGPPRFLGLSPQGWLMTSGGMDAAPTPSANCCFGVSLLITTMHSVSSGSPSVLWDWNCLKSRNRPRETCVDISSGEHPLEDSAPAFDHMVWPAQERWSDGQTLGSGREKHIVTHILRWFIVKPILFAIPRTNTFGLEN